MIVVVLFLVSHALLRRVITGIALGHFLLSSPTGQSKTFSILHRVFRDLEDTM